MACDFVKLPSTLVQSHDVKPWNAVLQLELGIFRAVGCTILQGTDNLSKGLKGGWRNLLCRYFSQLVSFHNCVELESSENWIKKHWRLQHEDFR